MSFEDFKTCVDNLPQDKPISFSGWGEPQLNPAFTDMVLYAHSAGHTVNLNTTLLGMTRESYERIRTVPFRSVTLHIPERDSNSHFTLSPEYFELLNLVLADVATGRFRITGYSCHGEVHPAVAAIFKENGLATPVGTPFSKLHDRAGNVKDKEVNHPKKRKGRILCALRSNLDLGVLLPDGTVDLCCMDMGMDWILGNLITQSYEQIMQGEAVQNLRRLMRSEKYGDCVCRHCCYAKSDFEYFVKIPIQRRISLIRRKLGLRTRLRRLFKKSTRYT